jgi:hypothetical protein
MNNRMCDKADVAIERGEFRWEKPNDFDDAATRDKKMEEYYKFAEKFLPQPDTPEWYQLIEGADYLVEWQLITVFFHN